MSVTKRRRLNPDERREQLLGLALEAYAQNGVDRAGHGDVAKLAGVSTATVFNYFPTREALTAAVFDEVSIKLRKVFVIVPDDRSRREQIQSMGEIFTNFIDQYPFVFKVFLNWSVAFSSDARTQYLELQDEILTSIQANLKGQREDRSDARIILGGAHVFAQMKFDNTPEEALLRLVSRIAEVLDLD